jgi:hypothetical protein
MSLFGQTLVLYLLIGWAVAVAVYLRTEKAGRLECLFRIGTAFVFWPLYLPLLLTRGGAPWLPVLAAAGPVPPDDLAVAIGQAEAELKAALAGTAGWADEARSREEKRLRDLPAIWFRQAERIRAMDRLLAMPDGAPVPQQDAITTPGLAGELRTAGISERLRHSLEVRRRNRERLRQVRQRAHEDLVGSLTLVRELVSMLDLARFTAASPARAADLLAQIAAAGDGLAGVDWDEEPSAAGGNP